jgi:hypothetical protein
MVRSLFVDAKTSARVLEEKADQFITS